MNRWSASLLGAALVTVVLLVVLVPLAWVKRPAGVVGIETSPLSQPLESRLEGGLIGGRVLNQPLGVIPDGLSEVDIYVSTFGHVNVAPLRLRVMDGAGEVRRAWVQLRHTDEDTTDLLARFSFAPMEDSGRRHLSVELSAPGANGATSVAPFVVVRQARGENLGKVQAAEPGPSVALPMGLRYGEPQPVWRQLGAAVERLSQYHPQPFKGAGVVIVMAIAILTSVGCLIGITAVAARVEAPAPR